MASSVSETAPKLVMAKLNDSNLCAAARLVSRYKPFAVYSFGLMMEKLTLQLKHDANLMVLQGNKLVAYAGWVCVDADQAEKWQIEGGDLPPAQWASGQAVIVTIVVTTDKKYLPLLIRGISHVCAGKKVYRMRSFQDGRQDMRRPPITGRVHRAA
jgi:hemolysin-activating ACP:hemolysin acyltransferase